MPSSDPDQHGYVIAATLGRGGNATVFRAERPGGGDPVALKVLHPDHRHEANLLRLHREFDLASHVHHRHSVHMIELGQHWLAMELVDGGDVSTLPTRAGRMAALVQIADALDTAHQLGIVHCDVKPTNMLAAQRGAVLIDFGEAHSLAADMAVRLSHDHTDRLSLDPARRITYQPPQRVLVQASLPYAAPELLLGHLPSGATDQYGLACTAIELLTGATPFTATSASAMIDAQLDELPPRVSQRAADLPRGIDAVVSRALAKDPTARYASCTEFVRLLTETLG